MRCIDCLTEKKDNLNTIVNEAEQILILDNPEKVLPLCPKHIENYIHMEGEMNLDFFYVKISGVGEDAFVQELNQLFEYHDRKYSNLLQEYTKLKKEVKP